MSSTRIESKLHRVGGSIIPLGGIDYHFKPYTDGAHVCEVANEDHADRFLSITEGFKLYRGNGIPADGSVADTIITKEYADGTKATGPAPLPDVSPAFASSVLLGGDFPASFDIHGKTYALGDVVAAAHESSGLTVEAWNALPVDERDGKIEAELDRIAAAGEQAASTEDERTALVDQYTKLYGEAPHARTGVKKLRELIAAKQ
jgi:hypothetical protein